MEKRHLLVAAIATIGVILYHFGVPMWLYEPRGSDLDAAPSKDEGEETATETADRPSADDAPSADDEESDAAKADAKDEEVPIDEQPLAERIPKEEQAFFLHFRTDGAFYHMLEPGDRVDLTAVADRKAWSKAMLKELDIDDPSNPPGTRWLALTLLQNVEVLGVRPHPENGKSGATVLLSVTDEEYNLLELFDAPGSIDLHVRHPDNFWIGSVEKTTFRRTWENLEVIREKRKDRLEDRSGELLKQPHAGAFDEEDFENTPEELSDDGSSESDRAPDIECDGSLASRVPTSSDEVRAVHVDASLPSRTVECGDRVDIHVEFDANLAEMPTDAAKPADRVSATLIESLPVLGVTRDDSAIDGLVLAVSFRETPLLRLATRYGQLDFALRHPDDLGTTLNRRKSVTETFEQLSIINRPRGPKPDEVDESNTPDIIDITRED